MFQDISQIADPELVSLRLDGEEIQVPAGYTVAAAILIQQRRHNRTSPVSGSRRGPYCLMGGCFECLVEIDGIANQQACMTEVREGMSVAAQQGAGAVKATEELGYEL